MSGRLSLFRGRSAESCACVFLEQLGLRILARNFRSRFGEIDIIAQEGDTLVFTEVKTRGVFCMGSAFEAVNRSKQQKIIRTALLFLSRSDLDDLYIRFDVIAVDANGKCSRLCDAFGPDDGDC
ncbi:YraN family protein [Desulfobotulus sp. H1]|uniref:UPF0102 protein OOT00_11110 n=1 Tax=Desulfobotulus pelophilus TaxID=2823377 RepID=A0ABT3NAQ7_9BACT|nr:YraN family protein [Desulfobotulus pelophilus]MCW7754534.1 YraN family protein [Desulfobotulus pelophilus]